MFGESGRAAGVPNSRVVGRWGSLGPATKRSEEMSEFLQAGGGPEPRAAGYAAESMPAQ